jgi:hypothetical protein
MRPGFAALVLRSKAAPLLRRVAAQPGYTRAESGAARLDWIGLRPVEMAPPNGFPSAIRILLESGVKPDLFGASYLGLNDRVREILKGEGRNAPPKDPWSRDGETADWSVGTPLHWAVLGRQAETMDLLLNHWPCVEVRNARGMTPLLLATGLGRMELVEVLLRHGANGEAADREGATPLEKAIENGYTDIADCLRNAGARR